MKNLLNRIFHYQTQRLDATKSGNARHNPVDFGLKFAPFVKGVAHSTSLFG